MTAPAPGRRPPRAAGGEPPRWSPAQEAAIARIRSRYETPEAATLPLLWLAQDAWGWISQEVMALVAETLGVTPAHVHSVVTFYTMFRTEPPGRWHLEVCRTLSCAVSGAEGILQHLEGRLGITAGETRSDGAYSLEAVECLAACGAGPVMQVNGRLFERMTPAGADALLAALDRGEMPSDEEAAQWTWDRES